MVSAQGDLFWSISYKIIQLLIRHVVEVNLSPSSITLSLTTEQGRKNFKPYRRFKVPKPPDNQYRMTRCTKFFRRRGPGNFRKNDHCFICNKPGHFAKNFPQIYVKTLQLFDDIDDHKGYFESVFSLEDEARSETLFLVYVYEMDSDASNIDDYPCHNMYPDIQYENY